jgi:hypothetical protein
MEFTNRPVCAVKDRDRFVSGAATPPWKGGEWGTSPYSKDARAQRAPSPRIWRDSSGLQFSKTPRSHLLDARAASYSVLTGTSRALLFLSPPYRRSSYSFGGSAPSRFFTK